MADSMALRSHGGSDGPQRLSLGPKRSHFANRLLLGLVDKLAMVAATEPEGTFPPRYRPLAF
jgi:hypothetical protein